MKKMQLALLLLSFSLIQFSCFKNKDSDSKPPEYDAVVGNYMALPMYSPPGYITGSVSVSKTGNGQYKLNPGSASIPSFTFEHNPLLTLFVNGFGYTIPKQTSGTILLDSAFLTFYTPGANTISFTLKSSAASTSWIYDGVKQ